MRAAASSANRRRQRLARAEGIDKVSDDEDVYAESEPEEEQEEVTEWKPKRTIRLTHKNKRKADGEVSTLRKSMSGGTRRQRSTRKERGDTDEEDDNDTDDDGHLSSHQRRLVQAAFRLFTSKLQEVQGGRLEGQDRLSKEDLKLLVTSVGEKIPDKEVRTAKVAEEVALIDVQSLQIEEMIDEGMRFFAKASSRDATRQGAKLRREAAAGRAAAQGQPNRTQTVGIDE